MPERRYALDELHRDFKTLGIAPGDIVIMHSSMKSIGPVRGGPRSVIRALQRAVTRRGAILMPTFSYNFELIYTPAEPYDPADSPSRTGLITEVFRRSPGVVRSGHPTHSVAAWGRGAREMVAGHESISALGTGSPFHRAAERGAKVCMVGCGFASLSLLHVAEHLAQVPYLGIFCGAHAGRRSTALVRGCNGEPRAVSYPTTPGCSRSFGVAEDLAHRRGLLRRGRLGGASVLLFDAGQLLGMAVKRLRRRPDWLLCPAGSCRACDERRVMVTPLSRRAAFARDVIVEIVRTAGPRIAGGAAEGRAAEIIARRMSESGLSNVRTHLFPITAWEPGFSGLQVRRSGGWHELPSAPVAHAPASGGWIEGTAVNVESMTELSKVRDARRSIAVLWDGYGRSLDEFRRLMHAGFRAFVLVDTRFSHGDIVAEGVPSQWLDDYRTPMITVPHSEAVRVFGRGPLRCRLRVTGARRRAESSVVSGEIVGASREVLLIAAHHDSTYNAPGADDDLSGVAALLLVARALRRERGFRRTIRFCSFGAEEQLSEGARWYAIESGLAKDVRLVVNNDSLGAYCGTTKILYAGTRQLEGWLGDAVRASRLQFKIAPEISPFGDQFPFNVRGVPSIWFHRQTIASGRHYHHTVRDSLCEVSFEHVARLAQFEAGLVRQLACARRLPFPDRLSPDIRRIARRAGADWLCRS